MSTSSWNEREKARELAIAKKKINIAIGVVNESDKKLSEVEKAAGIIEKYVKELEKFIHALEELQSQAKKGSLSDTMINYLKKHKVLSSDAARNKVFKLINSGKINQLIGKLKSIKSAATMTLGKVSKVTSAFKVGVKGARLLLDLRKAALNDVNTKRKLAESCKEMKEAYKSMKNVMGLINDVKNMVGSLNPIWILLGTYIGGLNASFVKFEKAVKIMDKHVEKIEEELKNIDKLRDALENRRNRIDEVLKW